MQDTTLDIRRNCLLVILFQYFVYRVCCARKAKDMCSSEKKQDFKEKRLVS